MSHLGTRERLLVIVQDMEIITKDILECCLPNKNTRNGAETVPLVELLVSKNAELNEMLVMAEEQAKVEEIMDELREKVEVQDLEIQKLQRTFKEAEQLLSTALFQARNKLSSIQQANKSPVSVEELIKYSQRISAANAVSAPLTWTIGDIRRPYPNDVNMRNGFLGKSELNVNGGLATHQNNNIPDVVRTGNISAEVPNAFQNQFNWNTMGELHMSMGSAASSVPLETRTHKETSQDDVEVMSTDSSSSSSSDSQ